MSVSLVSLRAAFSISFWLFSLSSSPIREEGSKRRCHFGLYAFCLKSHSLLKYSTSGNKVLSESLLSKQQLGKWCWDSFTPTTNLYFSNPLRVQPCRESIFSSLAWICPHWLSNALILDTLSSIPFI